MHLHVSIFFPIVCLFVCFFTSQSTIFQLCPDQSSWVEPVLSKNKCALLKDTMQWRPWASGPLVSSQALYHWAPYSVCVCVWGDILGYPNQWEKDRAWYRGHASPFDSRLQSEVQVGSDKLTLVHIASFCYLADMLSAAKGHATRVKTILEEVQELPVLISRHLLQDPC